MGLIDFRKKSKYFIVNRYRQVRVLSNFELDTVTHGFWKRVLFDILAVLK